MQMYFCLHYFLIQFLHGTLLQYSIYITCMKKRTLPPHDHINIKWKEIKKKIKLFFGLILCKRYLGKMYIWKIRRHTVFHYIFKKFIHLKDWANFTLNRNMMYIYKQYSNPSHGFPTLVRYINMSTRHVHAGP